MVMATLVWCHPRDLDERSRTVELASDATCRFRAGSVSGARTLVRPVLGPGWYQALEVGG
jgi:hypothetical protein